MYGGDEVGAVVLDIGSLLTKAGFAGEDTPKALFQTAVGTQLVDAAEDDRKMAALRRTRLPDEEELTAAASSSAAAGASSSSAMQVEKASASGLRKKYYVGRSALFRRDGMELSSPVEYGEIKDWDAVERIISYAFHDHLRINCSDHPFLLADPTFAPPAQRERMLSLSFEKFHTPAAYLCRSAVLSAFASGRGTAAVLEMGAGVSQSVPVHDGFVLTKGIRKTKMAGSFLDLISEKLFFSGQYKDKELLPLYMLNKKIDSSSSSSAAAAAASLSLHAASSSSSSSASASISHAHHFNSSDVSSQDRLRIDRLHFPLTRPSFHRYMQLEVVRDMKESLCKALETRFDVDDMFQRPPQAYVLPDGTTMDIGNERFAVAEHLFFPDVCRPRGTAATAAGAGAGAHQSHYADLFQSLVEGFLEDDLDKKEKNFTFTGLHRMLISSVESMDVDVRKELYNNIVVTGGCSLLPGLLSRLHNEISNDIATGSKVKIHNWQATTIQSDRRFATWLGGSILASLGSFHQMWVSKAEYEEMGAAQCVLKKCNS